MIKKTVLSVMLVVSIGIVVVVFLMYGRDPALEQVKPAELHAPMNRKPHYKLSAPVFPVKKIHRLW